MPKIERADVGMHTTLKIQNHSISDPPTMASAVPIPTANGWSEGSRTYEKYFEPGTAVAAEAMVTAMNDVKPVTKESRVLDVGVGTGAATMAMHRSFPSVPIRAVDLSPGMLEIISGRNIPGLSTAVADATQLDRSVVPLGGFSHVMCAMAIQFCEDKQLQAVRELYDSAEPQGIVALSIGLDITVPEPFNLTCEALDPHYKRASVYSDKAWKTMEQLEDAMKTAGLRDVTSKTVFAYLNTKSLEEYEDCWWNGNHPAYRQHLASWTGDMELVKSKMKEVYREHLANGGKVGALIGIAVGTKPV